LNSLSRPFLVAMVPAISVPMSCRPGIETGVVETLVKLDEAEHQACGAPAAGGPTRQAR
jgi:hypothetical protein